jgi:hypothetical protein
MPGFYEAGELEQVAVNLFYGWGYNFYRHENQLRADDLLIREKASWLLGQARAIVEAAESAWRRKHLTPPTRAKPLPDPDAVDAARSLEDLSSQLGELEATIRSLPVPENDRMTQRYRQEAETLGSLGEADKKLIGLAGVILRMMDGKDADWMLANIGTLREGIALARSRVTDRASLLK